MYVVGAWPTVSPLFLLTLTSLVASESNETKWQKQTVIVDMAFVIDVSNCSGHYTTEAFNLMKTEIIKSIDYLKLGSKTGRIGVVDTGQLSTTNLVNLTYDRTVFNANLAQVQLMPETVCNVTEGLKKAETMLKKSGRSYARKAIVLIRLSAPLLEDLEKSLLEARRIRELNFSLFAMYPTNNNGTLESQYFTNFTGNVNSSFSFVDTAQIGWTMSTVLEALKAKECQTYEPVCVYEDINRTRCVGEWYWFVNENVGNCSVSEPPFNCLMYQCHSLCEKHWPWKDDKNCVCNQAVGRTKLTRNAHLLRHCPTEKLCDKRCRSGFDMWFNLLMLFVLSWVIVGSTVLGIIICSVRCCQNWGAKKRRPETLSEEYLRKGPLNTDARPNGNANDGKGQVFPSILAPRKQILKSNSNSDNKNNVSKEKNSGDKQNNNNNNNDNSNNNNNNNNKDCNKEKNNGNKEKSNGNKEKSNGNKEKSNGKTKDNNSDDNVNRNTNSGGREKKSNNETKPSDCKTVPKTSSDKNTYDQTPVEGVVALKSISTSNSGASKTPASWPKLRKRQNSDQPSGKFPAQSRVVAANSPNASIRRGFEKLILSLYVKKGPD